MKTIVLLARAQMGHGDPELGERILKTFLQKSIALQGLDAILLFNEGVKLTGVDSPVRGELAMLEEDGVDLVPCGTCLEHYGVEPAVGSVGSMDQIIRAIHGAEKVVTL
ncbi:MAG: hypothetical protein AAGB93_07840 [Planctomycetota bacterium]